MHYLTRAEIEAHENATTDADVLYALNRFEAMLKAATEDGHDLTGIYDHDRALEVRMRLMGIPTQLLGA